MNIISPPARRLLGATGLEVSVLSFGAWSIGGPADLNGLTIGWSGVDDRASLRALQTALDRQINTFDTADSYADGHSEELIGQALAHRRDECIFISKTGIAGADAEGIVLDFSPARIFHQCENSLRRLRTDYLDVYLLHLVNARTFPTEDTVGALNLLQQAGKIRHFGISVQFPEQGIRQIEAGIGQVMMIEYNPLSAPSVVETIQRAHAAGVGILSRGALAKGLLTGKYRPGHDFPRDDVRSRIPPAQRDGLIGKVGELVRRGWTRRQLLASALSFPLLQSGCSSVVVGCKTTDQVEENLLALAEPVPFQEDWLRLLHQSKS